MLKRIFLILLVFVCICGFCFGDIFVVDPNGFSDFTTIQGAIDDVGTGDVVIVMPGTYVENINMQGKAITLRSSDPTDGAVVGATIIDGGGVGSVITCDSGEDPNTVIDGFLITNGKGTAVGHSYCGGGMLNSDSSPTVSNCTFSVNTAYYGGGMYNMNNSSPTISNCTFDENTAGGDGGGMLNFYSSPTVSNCTFDGNTAGDIGGGMYNKNSSPTVSNCAFSENTAGKTAGGMYNEVSSSTVSNCAFSGNSADDGGGMLNTYSSPTVSNCTFDGNTADNGGGGMYNFYSWSTVSNCAFSGNSAGGGGGMYNGNSSPTVSNCTFSVNTSYYGGGMYNENSSPTVINCAFSWNTAGGGGGGGGMYNGDSSPTVSNCTFSVNTSYDDGGGMLNFYSSSTVSNCAFVGNTASYDGGGMYNWESPPTVSNCMFDGNTAGTTGGGMRNHSSSPTISNCIIWGNSAVYSGDQIFNFDESRIPRISYCDIEGSFGSGGWDTGLGDDGGGNIDSDPLFVDADGADDILGTEDDDFRLRAGSVCIDAGDDSAVIGSIDMDGFARVVDGDCDDVGRVDMGAYEFNRFVPGDFDGLGCDVDNGDFAVLAESWLGDNPAIDIAPAGGDGIIDFNELLVLSENWLLY